MLSIYKSEKFIKEYNDFKSAINKITDVRIRSNIEGLLLQLVQKIKSLDTQHQELIYSKQIRSLGADAKEDILNLRKTIIKKIKEAESI